MKRLIGYDYNQLATDLYCVVTSIGLYNFTLVGFSMGGAIVTRYMAIYNGYGVSKLCLWDAAVPSYCKTYHNPYGSTKEEVNQLLKQGYMDRPKLNEYFGSIFFAKEHSIPLKNWFQRMSDSASSVGQLSALKSLRDEDVFQDMQYINVPTGIFHGKKDKICPYPFSKIQKDNIQYAKVFTFEEGGHGSFYDELEKFTKEFTNFLQE